MLAEIIGELSGLGAEPKLFYPPEPSKDIYGLLSDLRGAKCVREFHGKAFAFARFRAAFLFASGFDRTVKLWIKFNLI